MLAGLTARQFVIVAVAAVVIWIGWAAARRAMTLPEFAALAAPVGLAAVALVTGERDGLPLDRLLAAAWRYARSPRRLVTAPQRRSLLRHRGLRRAAIFLTRALLPAQDGLERNAATTRGPAVSCAWRVHRGAHSLPRPAPATHLCREAGDHVGEAHSLIRLA